MPTGQGESDKDSCGASSSVQQCQTEVFRWLDTAHTISCRERGVQVVMNADVDHEGHLHTQA